MFICWRKANACSLLYGEKQKVKWEQTFLQAMPLHFNCRPRWPCAACSFQVRPKSGNGTLYELPKWRLTFEDLPCVCSNLSLFFCLWLIVQSKISHGVHTHRHIKTWQLDLSGRSFTCVTLRNVSMHTGLMQPIGFKLLPPSFFPYHGVYDLCTKDNIYTVCM